MFINTPAQQVGSAALVATVALTAWRGGRPERIGVAIIACAWILTPFVELRGSWYQPQWGIFGVDVLNLLALASLAFIYDRRWPVCAAGFQAIAVLTHVAFLINPHALYRGYFYANFAVGFLLLGSLLGGIVIELSSPHDLSWRALSRLRQATRLSRP